MKAINRYNYEEFFLLYLDNELDAEQKEAVEKFVQQNTDLSVEMDMLMQTKVMPEHGIVFTSKENLVRTEGNSINETNYEEYFLLYLDNELSAAKKQEVETYILQHPKLQDEFILLKQAVLQPENISYSNKEELYRREGRRVIHFKPWRMAAAAVFIGLCAIGWWLVQKPLSTGTVADVPAATDQAKQNAQQVEPGIVQQEIKKPETSNQQTALANKEVKPAAASKKNDTRIQRDQAKNEVYHQTLPAKNEVQEKEPAKHEQLVIAHNDAAKESTIDQPDNIVTELPEVAENIQPNNTGSNSYNIYPVTYKVIDPNDQDQSVHVAMLDLNKNKVRSFLKKAGRLFNNKSNDLANEDGKLQVANFEIETNKQ